MTPRLFLSLTLIGALGVAACDSSAAQGINSLGNAFVRMFNQDRNSEPVDAQSVPLTLRPTIEPFNP